MYLIDNSNFCYKYKSVHSYAQTVVNGVSVDVSVLAGYLKSLKINPFDDIYIVLDGVPMESLAILPGYKGQRNKESDDRIYVPKLEVAQFLSKIGERLGKNIKLVCAPGQEADQVISSIVHLVTNNIPPRYKFLSQLRTKELTEDRVLAYLQKGNPKLSSFEGTSNHVVVGTTDSDMAQLCALGSVSIDESTSGRGIRLGSTPVAVHNLPPAAIPIYKAICGDISDNVPTITTLSPTKVAAAVASIKTKEQAQEFINQVQSGTSTLAYQGLILECQKHIREFNRNLDVVELRFYSIPYVVEFPDYDISSTIKKYGLRM